MSEDQSDKVGEETRRAAGEGEGKREEQLEKPAKSTDGDVDQPDQAGGTGGEATPVHEGGS
jgi:hypothetical protein